MDVVATRHNENGKIVVACVNKHEFEDKEITLCLPVNGDVRVTSLTGNSPDDYNDIGRDSVHPFENADAVIEKSDNCLRLRPPAHSVNIVEIG